VEFQSKQLDRVVNADNKEINQQVGREFIQIAQDYRSLMEDIQVVVPVRPGDGTNNTLCRMLSIWTLVGVNWAHLEDGMGGFIEFTRSKMVTGFLRDYDSKYLLMIDNDMEPPLYLPLLLARHDVPIVGAPACSMSFTGELQLCFTVQDVNGEYRFPSVRGVGKIPATGLIEVGHVGTGAMMVRRDVLESFNFKDEGDVPFYVPEAERLAGAREGRLLTGEDIAFCNQAREKGFNIMVDLEAHCGHRKAMNLTWDPRLMDPTIDAQTWKIPPDSNQAVRFKHADARVREIKAAG
jgi:hypothetical protein